VLICIQNVSFGFFVSFLEACFSKKADLLEESLVDDNFVVCHAEEGGGHFLQRNISTPIQLVKLIFVLTCFGLAHIFEVFWGQAFFYFFYGDGGVDIMILARMLCLHVP